ncbi:MAG: DUF721 domain-containing protein [Planctomycetota bacterium]
MPDEPLDERDARDRLGDLARRSEAEARRFRARSPQPIAGVVSDVIAKRGVAAQRAHGAIEAGWQEVAAAVLGDEALARQTRCAGVSRGRLDVVAASGVLVQELGFHKRRIVEELSKRLPDARVQSIRIKAGRIDG